jgi:dTDP-4-amino-4,6-dideoxygalactose transaminase
MKVPLLDLQAHLAPIRPDIDAAIARVIDHAAFIMGPEIKELEVALARLCQVPHAVGCASGTDALLLALTAAGVGPGDRVIIPPFTFFATASCITRLGAIPVFVDIEPDTFLISPSAVTGYLSNCSASERATVKAIIPVHLFGQCADMDAITEIARERRLEVIEDAAQAIGSLYKGRAAGSMGTVGCFSFFPSKNLGGIGDGGFMTARDREIAHRLSILRVHGMEPKYYHREVGINSRLDTLQAAVLLVMLPHLERWTEDRRRLAARYRELFAGSTVRLPLEASHGRHVYNQFTIRVSNRDVVRTALQAFKIGCDVHYPVPLHLQECFSGLGYHEGDFPEAEAAARECLSIPVYPEMKADQQRLVVDVIRRYAE